MAIFVLTLHVGKTGIGHRDHKKVFRQLLGSIFPFRYEKSTSVGAEVPIEVPINL